MDVFSPEMRSEVMRRIRGRNTRPELTVRSFLHRAGLRFRLHRPDLPGKPDIVLPSRHACIFVHGCFWHGCQRCVSGRKRVKSNAEYWRQKITRNRHRDRKNAKALRAAGWHVFEIWECQIKHAQSLEVLVSRLRSLPKADQ